MSPFVRLSARNHQLNLKHSGFQPCRCSLAFLLSTKGPEKRLHMGLNKNEQKENRQKSKTKFVEGSRFLMAPFVESLILRRGLPDVKPYAGGLR